MPRRQHDSTPGSFAAKLQRLRAKLKITQQEAAELAGVSKRTWVAWENEQNVPSGLTIAGLKQIFADLK